MRPSIKDVDLGAPGFVFRCRKALTAAGPVAVSWKLFYLGRLLHEGTSKSRERAEKDARDLLKKHGAEITHGASKKASARVQLHYYVKHRPWVVAHVLRSAILAHAEEEEPDLKEIVATAKAGEAKWAREAGQTLPTHPNRKPAEEIAERVIRFFEEAGITSPERIRGFASRIFGPSISGVEEEEGEA